MSWIQNLIFFYIWQLDASYSKFISSYCIVEKHTLKLYSKQKEKLWNGASVVSVQHTSWVLTRDLHFPLENRKEKPCIWLVSSVKSNQSQGIKHNVFKRLKFRIQVPFNGAFSAFTTTSRILYWSTLTTRRYCRILWRF